MFHNPDMETPAALSDIGFITYITVGNVDDVITNAVKIPLYRIVTINTLYEFSVFHKMMAVFFVGALFESVGEMVSYVERIKDFPHV